jgi:hypothetical protein
LLYTAGPSTKEVGHYPAAGAIGSIKIEVRPGQTSPRVFDYTAELTRGCESCFKATSIVSKLLALAGELYGQWLTEPHFPPTLAWRMRYDRPRAIVFPRIAFFIPRVDAIESIVGTVLLNVEGRDHFSSFNSGQIHSARPVALSLSHIAIECRRSKLSHLTKSGGLGFVFGMGFPRAL